MKKFLLVLFVAAAIFAGCQKDTSPIVKIGSSDLAAINGKLQGMWLFPSQTQKIVDSAGRTLVGTHYVEAPAMEFDGGSKVKIYEDTQTILNGTYRLMANGGFVYLDVMYPDSTDVNYKILYSDLETLKLTSTQPYLYSKGTTPIPAKTISNLLLKKQTSADVTANLIRVVVNSDTAYNVAVYITHTKTDTAVMLDSKLHATGVYNYVFASKSGDQLTVDIGGDYTKTTFYAYYNGLPMAGVIAYNFQELKTTTGWIVP